MDISIRELYYVSVYAIRTQASLRPNVVHWGTAHQWETAQTDLQAYLNYSDFGETLYIFVICAGQVGKGPWELLLK